MKIVPIDVRKLAVRRFGEETAIVDLRGRTVHRLNATAAQLWGLIVAGAGYENLVSHLCQTYEVEADEAGVDVKALLRSLVDAGLVRVEGMTLGDEGAVDAAE